MIVQVTVFLVLMSFLLTNQQYGQKPTSESSLKVLSVFLTYEIFNVVKSQFAFIIAMIGYHLKSICCSDPFFFCYCSFWP